MLPQLFEDALPAPLHMHLSGEIAESDPAPLRTAFLAALLQVTTERRVSIVNALTVAQEIGVTLEVVAEHAAPAFASLMTLWAGERRIAATVLGGGPRIVDIDGYELDAIPHGAWIVTRHEDVPGMVGRIGTILGQANVNIATMQVARDAQHAAALMVLAVDRAPGGEHVAAMRAIPGMRRVDVAVL
ncbi:MAG: ACT domain-containing protein [Candidatus Baltobacteraceae bacterium]